MATATLTAGSLPARPAVPDTISTRRVIAFLAMVFGMFMAILDIQIVSASLSEIQAGLSASSDEIPWVQTAYLIAEVVMIPLSGFLGRMLSTRVLFTVAAAGFTAASALCCDRHQHRPDDRLPRLQGFIGGGMIPSVFAAAFTIFPPSRRAIVSPIIGLVATLAPTIGPTVGGYLSHAFSWHWLFLVNVVPGILVTIAGLVADRLRQARISSCSSKFDWWGLAGMAAFLGCMEYVLEEGPQQRLAAGSGSAHLRRRHDRRRGAVLLARLHRRGADRRPEGVQQHQLRFRLAVFVRHRRRPLWPDLSLSGLSSGASAATIR